VNVSGIRFELDRPAIGDDGIIEFTLIRQGNAQIGKGFGVVGPERDGL